jgi:hypothetical protein
MFGRRHRPVQYKTIQGPSDPVIQGVAELLMQAPELVAGYLVVGFRVDGTVAVAHNTCCLPHQVNRLVDQVRKNPALGAPREKYRESHGS